MHAESKCEITEIQEKKDQVISDLIQERLA